MVSDDTTHPLISSLFIQVAQHEQEACFLTSSLSGFLSEIFPFRGLSSEMNLIPLVIDAQLPFQSPSLPGRLSVLFFLFPFFLMLQHETCKVHAGIKVSLVLSDLVREN